MTLGEFLNALSDNPTWILFYFIALPIIAGLSWLFGKGEGKLSPWKELYSVLTYAVCIPGIFAFTLNIYTFLFERKSIYSLDVYSQILPIFSMVVTLYLIRKNTCFEDIPGFGKLGGLIVVILALFTIMWLLEKTHIFVISIMPFHYFIVLFVLLFIAIRYGAKRFMS